MSCPAPALPEDASRICISPLVPALIDTLDQPDWLPVLPDIVHLLVNLSALSSEFAQLFLEGERYGFEKLVHALGTFSGDLRNLLELLTYNVLYHIAPYVLESTCFLQAACNRVTSAIVDPDDISVLFFAPFSMIPLLRSMPVPIDTPMEQNCPNAEFIFAMTALLSCSGSPLEMGMWALYFWFKNSWDHGAFACFITSDFMKAIWRMLTVQNEAVLKIALWVHSHLWIHQRGCYRRELVLETLANKYGKHDALLVQLVQHPVPEIAALALLMLHNFVAEDPHHVHVFDASILPVLCEIIADGPASAKLEAGHLLVTMLWCLSGGEQVEWVNEGVVHGLMDAAEIGDLFLSEYVFECLQHLAPACPQVVDVLLAADYDEYLAQMEADLNPGDVAETLYCLITHARAGAGADTDV
jgi:hypothetical protein